MFHVIYLYSDENTNYRTEQWQWISITFLIAMYIALDDSQGFGQTS